MRVVKVIWQNLFSFTWWWQLSPSLQHPVCFELHQAIHSLPNSHFHRFWVVLAELIVHLLKNDYDQYSATFLLISPSFEWFIFHHWNCVWSILSMNKHFQNLRWLSIFSISNTSKLMNKSFGLPRIFINFCVDFF